MDLMDINNFFYMVEFDGEEDKTKVINGEPRIISGHYFTLRQWVSSFNIMEQLDNTFY